MQNAIARPAIPFAAVNRPRDPHYRPGMQRHHLLPRQLLSRHCFAAMFDHLHRARIGFDDFRRNGLLLPSDAAVARRLALPLHRGPHRAYNELVAERVGQIEHGWSRTRTAAAEGAACDALMRLSLLQDALRRRLLAAKGPRLRLSRNDPLGAGVDFTELDAMAEQLWQGSEAIAKSRSPSPAR